jgi:hypothetical protein
MVADQSIYGRGATKIEVSTVFTKGIRLKSLEALFGKLRMERFNRVDIDCTGGRMFGMKMLNCHHTFKPSPTSELWMGTRLHEISGHPKAAGAAPIFIEEEYIVKGSEVNSCPTTLRTIAAVDTPGITTDRFAQMLLNMLEAVPADLEVFGVAHFHNEAEKAYAPFETLEYLRPWAKTYNDLGKRFGYLSEWMLGRFEVLACMAANISMSDLVVTSRRNSAILHIPRDLLQGESLPGLEPFIVNRSGETRAYRPGHGKDEFVFGAPHFTRKRYEYLLATDRIPTKPWFPHNMVLPVVADNYCQMMGIDPQNMLVSETYDYLWQDFQSDVDQFFLETEESSPIIDRVWQAHVRAFNAPGKWNTRRTNRDLIRFVHDRYFAEAE